MRTITKQARQYGYTWAGMKVITVRQAMRSQRQVYCLYADNTEGTADCVSQIQDHYDDGGFFGVEYAPGEVTDLVCPLCGEFLVFDQIIHTDDMVHVLFACDHCGATLNSSLGTDSDDPFVSPQGLSEARS